jgi:hypothetical protein
VSASQDLPFESIRNELETLPLAVANKIEREWPAKWASVTDGWLVLAGHVRVANNTLKSIRYLCADLPPDPARKLQFASSVPPMARTILDSLFTAVFLFENLPAQMELYTKSGWRELYEEHQRYQAAYGNDPDWATWLTEVGRLVTEAETRYGVSAAEVANPSSIKWFPNPGKMAKHKAVSPPSATFLTYMNDWFYKSLSAASHLSLPGLLVRAGRLFEVHLSDDDEEFLKKYKSDCVLTAIIVLVALLSELQIQLSFDLAPRCKYLWGALSDFGAAKEVYDARYRALL